MNKTQYYLRYSLGGLDMILVTNIILKYFNLINWSWKKPYGRFGLILQWQL